MFIENKYYRWYLAITATDDVADYVEKHHRIPRSMGGGNERQNIVRLTLRKHFLAHWLLPKCTEGINRKKMLKALGCMIGNRKSRLPSWQYELARKAACEGRKGQPSPNKGRKASPEERRAISERQKGRKLPDEHKAKISQGNIGRVVSDDTKRKMSLKHTGKKLSEAHCTAIGESKRGTKSSPETCAKVSASLVGNTRKLGFKEPSETIERRNLAKRTSMVAQSNNTTGLKGITRMGNGRFRTRTKYLGRMVEIGIFDCPAAAHFAYVVKIDVILKSSIEGAVP